MLLSSWTSTELGRRPPAARVADRRAETTPSMRRRFVVSCPPIRPSHAIAEFADALIELLADLVARLRCEQRRQDRARERAHRERRQHREARRGRVALVLQTDLMEHVVRARKLLSKVPQHLAH